MLKLLHVADLHIGKNRRYPNYLERSEAMVREIHHLCVKHRVDIMAVPGDLLDNRAPTHEERSLAADFIGRAPVPVAIIPGNHEWIGPEWEDTALKWLNSLAPKFRNVKVWSRPAVEEWRGAWWVVIPYTGWNTASFHLVATHLVEQIPNDGKPIIGMAHEFFNGAVTDTGYMGKEHAKLPDLDRVSYWALGDIHMSQQMASNAWYCGAPVQQDFGEKLPKGVMIVEMGKAPVLVGLKRPKMLRVIHGVPRTWPTDCYVKLECAAKDLPSPLPSCVVALSTLEVEQRIKDAKQIHALVSSRYLSEGMDPFLRSRGFGPRRRQRAMKLCKGLIKDVER